MSELELLSMSENIENAFKSMTKSGRPDIRDDESKSMIKSLYEDIFDNDYALKQVLDDNHLLLEGRRGTGKSTVFVRAEESLVENRNTIPIYLNLQTIYEELPSYADSSYNRDFTYYLTYKNFMTSILEKLKNELKSKVKKEFSDDIDDLFIRIKDGEYYDKEFERSIELTSKQSESSNGKVNAKLSINSAEVGAGLEESISREKQIKEQKEEVRLFSIHAILKDIIRIVNSDSEKTIYLLIDDFSELAQEGQKIFVDTLIAPIISSYNKAFKVKIAGYPGRTYIGNIDKSKLPVLSLDFYDVFERKSPNSKYPEIEALATDYINRTIETRIRVFTGNQLNITDIFDTDKNNISEFMKVLFHATACIPRAMGFILNYCFLNSINKGKKITIANINSASEKYFNDNLLEDFKNDVRFKQSFQDDDVLLNHIAHINLMNKLVEKSKNNKKEIIRQVQNEDGKQVYKELIEKVGSRYDVPSSHFYINTAKENLLKTLELYFIVSKYNQGSSRDTSNTESYYALNYGLCQKEKIDFGRPEGKRRTYDYWRQDEFNYNQYIPKVLSSVEEIKCTECGKVYDEIKYEIYLEEKNCFKCLKHNTVKKVNVFASKFKDKLTEWKTVRLPDSYIEILRVLFNNQEREMTAHQIALEIDKHHLTITNASSKLKSLGYLDYRTDGKRYYKINEQAVHTFFTNKLDI